MSRSKLPAITALLRNMSTDPAELVSRLEPFENIDAEVLHGNGDGPEQADLIQAATQRIQWLMECADTDATVEVALIRSILHMMPPRFGPVSSKALWSANFPTLLAHVFEVLADSSAQQVHQQQSHGLLTAILQCIQDICASDYRLPVADKHPGQGERGIPARDRLGDLFIQPVLEFLPNTRYFPLPVRRHAAVTMLDLVTRSKHNQRLVAAPENVSQVDRVYMELLPAAADYPTQLDLLETLFRVGRSAAPQLLLRYLVGRGQALEHMRRALQTFTRNSAAEGPAGSSAIDLGALLRSVVLGYNTSLNEKASVFSYEIRALQVLGLPGVRQADPWVDLATASDPGGGHFSLTVLVPDPDDPEPAPETLTVPYRTVSSVTLREPAGTAAGADVCEVEISVSQLPEVLENVLSVGENCGEQDAPGASGSGRHGLSLLLTLRKDDARIMMLHFPKRCRDRLVVQSQDPRLAELSQPQSQVDRTYCKMSHGLSIHQVMHALGNGCPKSQSGQQQPIRKQHTAPSSPVATGTFDVKGIGGRAAATPGAVEDEDNGAQHSGSNVGPGVAGSRQLMQRLRQQGTEEQEPGRDQNGENGLPLLQATSGPSEAERTPEQNNAGGQQAQEQGQHEHEQQQQQQQQQGRQEQLHPMFPQPRPQLLQQQEEEEPKQQRQARKQQSACHLIAELQPPVFGDQASRKAAAEYMAKGLEARTAAAGEPALATTENGVSYRLPTKDRVPPLDARVKPPLMLPPAEVAIDKDNPERQDTSEPGGDSKRAAAQGVARAVPTSKGTGSKVAQQQSLDTAGENSGASKGNSGGAGGGGACGNGKAGLGSGKAAVGANLQEFQEAGRERMAPAGDKNKNGEVPLARKRNEVPRAQVGEKAGAEIKAAEADGASKKPTAGGQAAARVSTETGAEEVGHAAAGGADRHGLPHKKLRGGSAATDKGSDEGHQLLPRLSPQPTQGGQGTVSKTFVSRKTPTPSMQATTAGMAGCMRQCAEPNGRPPVGPTPSGQPGRGSGGKTRVAAVPSPCAQLPGGPSTGVAHRHTGAGAAAASPNMRASLDPIEDPDTPVNAAAAASRRAGSYLDGGASGAAARGKGAPVAEPAVDAKHGAAALTEALPQGSTFVDRGGVTEPKAAEDLPADDNEPMEEDAITGYNTSVVERLQDTAASPPEAGPPPALTAKHPTGAAVPKPRPKFRRGGAAAAAMETEKGNAPAAAGTGSGTGQTVPAQKRGRRAAVPEEERKCDPYVIDAELNAEEGGGDAVGHPSAAKKPKKGAQKGPEPKARAAAAQRGKEPVSAVAAPPPASAGGRPQRLAKVKALEAMADQLAPTQASPKKKSPQKQREQPQQQRPQPQAELQPPQRQVHKPKQAKQGAGTEGLSKLTAQSDQIPPPSDQVVVVPATFDGENEQRLRGVIPGESEAGAPCEGAADAEGGGGGGSAAEALRDMYAAWDKEDVAAEDEGVVEEEAAAAAEAQCRRSSLRVEGDLLLGNDPRVAEEEQRRPSRLVVDLEAPNVRLGTDIACEEAEADLLGGADGGAYPNTDVGGFRRIGGGGTASGLQVNGVAQRALNLVLVPPLESVSAGPQQATVAATVQATAAVTVTAAITQPRAGGQPRSTSATGGPAAVTITPGLPRLASLPAPPKSATAAAAAAAAAPSLAARPGPSNTNTAPAPAPKPPRGDRKPAQPTLAAEAAALLTAVRSSAHVQMPGPVAGGLAAPGAPAPGAGVMYGVEGAGLLGRLGMELSQEEPKDHDMSGGGGGGGGGESDDEGGGGLGVGGGFGRGAAVGKRLSFSTTTKLAALKPLPFMAGIRTPGGPTLGMTPAAAPAAAPAPVPPAAAQRSGAGDTGGAAGRRRGAGNNGAAGATGSLDGDEADAGDADMTALTGAVLRALVEDGDGEDEEAGQLQQLLAMMMQRKKRKVAIQQAAVLRETQQRVAASVQEIEDAVSKEAAALSNTARRIMGQIQTALGKKLAAIEALQTRRNEELSAAWEDYTDTYNRAAAAERELEAMLEKKRQELQRRVDTLSKAAAAQLTEAERRVSQARSTVSRMPGLQGLLAQLEAAS